MKNKKLVLVLVAAVTVLVGTVATAAAGVIPLLPGEGADGIIDMNQLPATEGVVDRNGDYVGEISRADLDADNSVVNVYNNGEHVGYFGPNGFYRLDEPPPIIDGKETWVEEWVDGAEGPARKERVDE